MCFRNVWRLSSLLWVALELPMFVILAVYALICQQVPAIQQRRIVAYLNQFVVHTVRFLNRFSTVCEEVKLFPHIGIIA